MTVLLRVPSSCSLLMTVVRSLGSRSLITVVRSRSRSRSGACPTVTPAPTGPTRTPTSSSAIAGVATARIAATKRYFFILIPPGFIQPLENAGGGRFVPESHHRVSCRNGGGRDLAYWGLGQGGGAAQITMSDPNRQFSRRGGVPSNDQIRAASVRARESLILSLIPYLTALATSSFTISASGIAIVIGKQ